MIISAFIKITLPNIQDLLKNFKKFKRLSNSILNLRIINLNAQQISLNHKKIRLPIIQFFHKDYKDINKVTNYPQTPSIIVLLIIKASYIKIKVNFIIKMIIYNQAYKKMIVICNSKSQQNFKIIFNQIQEFKIMILFHINLIKIIKQNISKKLSRIHNINFQMVAGNVRNVLTIILKEEKNVIDARNLNLKKILKANLNTC